MLIGVIALTGCGTSNDTDTVIEDTNTDVEIEQEIEGVEEEVSSTGDVIAGEYVNIDKMQFSVNGNVYTLGETVLQTLIDDGVPFDDRDIANVNNNISANNQSQGFRIELGDYWTGQVFVLNQQMIIKLLLNA